MRSHRSCRSAALVVASLALLLGACSDDGPARDDEGSIAEEGNLNAFSLRVGDCFNDPDGLEVGTQSTVLELPAVPCSQPHDNEVFALIDLEGGDDDYPGTEPVRSIGADRCLGEFEAYVGIAYEDSVLEFDPYLYPTAETWSAGDREIVCAVYNLDLAPLTGSVKGSAA